MTKKKPSDKVVAEMLDASREAHGRNFAAETGVYRNGKPGMILIPAGIIEQLAHEVLEKRTSGKAAGRAAKRRKVPDLLAVLDEAIAGLLDDYNGISFTLEGQNDLIWQLVIAVSRARGVKPPATLPDSWEPQG